ncbi:hypothetical protein [Fulvivirga sediminis]|uniref:Outer membrane protein beta-barrel domain-containing protein n=1 Tax=Fulvivirga sediminis TaxID=2803949 RepID=A0A937F2U2_9BACT|nr:hypothetical protein [Fulvivirga sediminis]MBL3655281.1 hypothetical protein [Fulvivirga sediminis]
MTTQNKITTTLKAVMLSLGMLLAFSGLAQEKTDSVIINVGKSKIIFLINDKQDLNTIKNYDLNAILNELSLKLETDSSQQQTLVNENNGEKTFITDTTIVIIKTKTDTIESDDDTEWKKEEKWENKENIKKSHHYFNLELGTNNYLSKGNFPDATDEPYTVRPWGSWYVAINSVNQTYISGPLYLEWGPGVSWYNFKFQNDAMRIYDQDEKVAFIEDSEYPDAHFKKSKLTVAYINFTVVPTLIFGENYVEPKNKWLNIHDNNSKSSFRIGAGGYVGYRIDSYSKIVFEEDGDKKKKRNHEDYHLNNFRYGLRFQLGYRETDLFINYDLNNLFSENRGPELKAISFGIIF